MNEDRMDDHILCIDRNCTNEKRMYTLARDAFAHSGHRTESLGSIFRRTRVHQGMTCQGLIRLVEDEREKRVSRYRAQVEEISQGLIREIPQQVDDNMQELIRILHEPREDGLPNLDLLNTMSPYFHTLENDVDVENSNSFATRVPRAFNQLLQLQSQRVKTERGQRGLHFKYWLVIALILMGIGAAIDQIRCDQTSPCELPPPVCPYVECPSPASNNPQHGAKVEVSENTTIQKSVQRFYGNLRSMLADTNITKNERIYLLENLAKHAQTKLQFHLAISDYQTLIALNPKDEVEYYKAIANLLGEADQPLKEYEVRQKVKYLVEREYGPNSILTAEQIVKMSNLERQLGLYKRYHSNTMLVLHALEFFEAREYMNPFWRNWLNSIQLPDEQLAFLQRKLAMFEDAYTPSDRNCLSVQIEIAQLLGNQKITKLVETLPKINDVFTVADIFKQIGDASRQLHNADKTQPDQRGNYYQKAYNLEKSQFDGSEHSIYLDSVDQNTPRLEMLQSIKDCIKYCPGMNQQRLADRGLQIINHYYPTTKFPESQAIVDQFMRLNLQ